VVKNKKILVTSVNHNHSIRTAKISRLILLNKLKQKAKSTNQKAIDIITSETCSLDGIQLQEIPKYDYLTDVIK
jgi:hypothetical protein